MGSERLHLRKNLIVAIFVLFGSNDSWDWVLTRSHHCPSYTSVECESCSFVSDFLRTQEWNSPGQNTGVGRCSILFPRGSFQPRNQTQVSCIADTFFISWCTRVAEYIPRKGMAGLQGGFLFIFFKLINCFQLLLYHFTLSLGIW